MAELRKLPPIRAVFSLAARCASQLFFIFRLKRGWLVGALSLRISIWQRVLDGVNDNIENILQYSVLPCLWITIVFVREIIGCESIIRWHYKIGGVMDCSKLYVTIIFAAIVHDSFCDL